MSVTSKILRMPGKWRIPWKFWRRAAQIGFLALFLWLFRKTEYDGLTEMPAAVNLFFRIDPLLATSATLAARTVIAALFPALLLLLLTGVLGRFFCGWICPLGTLLDGAHTFVKPRPGTRDRRWRRVKYFLLGTILFGAVVGVPLAGYFDPFANLFRGLTFSIDPLLTWTVSTPFDWIYREAPESVTNVSESVYGFLKNHVLAFQPTHYYLAGISFLILVGIVALEKLERRFWCRNLCPLGSMLALFGRFSLLRRIPLRSCPDCGKCQSDCRMGAFDREGRMAPEECNLCLDCLDDCPRSMVKFRFRRSSAAPAPFDVSRRVWLGAAGAGLVAGLVSHMDRAAAKGTRAGLLRPPGAPEEEEFLDLCVRCGECMKVCPTNVVQPALFESGWEGVFSPRLAYRTSYCEYNCTLCGQVCPTGAIPRLTEEEKHRFVIGKAEFDKNRCLPYAKGEPCIVCEEHCPVPDKAIRTREVEVVNADGETVKLHQPYVVFDLCTGCGICEAKCPLQGAAGIHVVRPEEAAVPTQEEYGYG